MPRVVINRLGPIDHVEIEEKNFMVFTGSQASGKSTIAKTIYFFRTIKNDILSLIIQKTTNHESYKDQRLYNMFESELKDKFMHIFGSSWGMDNNMFISYYFNDLTFVKISLREEHNYDTPNRLWIDYSKNIRDLLIEYNNNFMDYSIAIQDDIKLNIKKALCDMFSDPFESIYIPAGRSLITLLATQLNYIYSTMEEAQKRAIDYCTRSYLERILKIRPEFENGLIGLLNNNVYKKNGNSEILKTAYEQIGKILKGSYRYHNGDERLELTNNHYVKINFTSSGQQEVVWILNLIFYQLLQNQLTFFIIEEPESHLFPESQKYISELIALVGKAGNKVLVTTHSPYVLGSFNNLLYASQLPLKIQNQVNEIVNQKYWIPNDSFDAWFIKDGAAQNGIDRELNIIDNELLDEISQVINNDYDKMFELKLNNEEESE